MKNYKLLNNIFGWLVFAIATIVYMLTVEPTASWWDCGEFIATSYKFEVGHPPGAPIFMLLAKVFSLFAPNVTQVALYMNMLSVVATALTSMLVFWCITILGKKLLKIEKNSEITLAQGISLFGAGLVGALACTFADSIWFSAVEGEVYASSSFFTAIVFWAILKWEAIADEPRSDRWIVLIALLIGISIGVHLLNLLAIPAMALVIYFKRAKKEVTVKRILIVLAMSFVALFVVQIVVIQWIAGIAGRFELFFVNKLHMPFNSGIVIYLVLFAALIVWSLWYTQKQKKALLNLMLVSFTCIIIGFSAFSIIVIRSNANTPLNENDPSNVFTLISYLNREQYGDRPLIYGQYYDAEVLRDNTGKAVTKKGKKIYRKGDTEYLEVGEKLQYKFDGDRCSIFPRMYSPDGRHTQMYEAWGDVKRGKPTFSNNIRYFMKYQIQYMYGRYFMWNFSGRQTDIQGHGFTQGGKKEIRYGNWLTGIKFIDEARLGNQEDLPSNLKDNKARNAFYMLPFLIGLLGMIYQFSKDWKNGLIVAMLFFMTGLAITFYLNQTPMQPRERDYSYAGSFLTFTIWIGLGVLSLIEILMKLIKKKKFATIVAAATTVVCLALVPGIMAQQGWDDHDRSGKYAARDFATNYLESCDDNAILVAFGDNDTFPLWYAQEVEGIRTDIRVLNFTLSSGDWYIKQLGNKLYESDIIPMSIDVNKYQHGSNDVIYVGQSDQPIDIRRYIDDIQNDNLPASLIVPTGNKNPIYQLPGNIIRIPVDTAKIRAEKLIPEDMMQFMVPYMDIYLKPGTALVKNDIMMLDVLATNNWERPIYMINPNGIPNLVSNNEGELGINHYMHQEGFVYRLLPVLIYQTGGIMTETSYEKIVNGGYFENGNLADPTVYFDLDSYRMTQSIQNSITTIAVNLIARGENEKAETILDLYLEKFPIDRMPIDYRYTLNQRALQQGVVELNTRNLITLYYELGDLETASILAISLAQSCSEQAVWVNSLKSKFVGDELRSEAAMALGCMQSLYTLAVSKGDKTTEDAILAMPLFIPPQATNEVFNQQEEMPELSPEDQALFDSMMEAQIANQ